MTHVKHAAPFVLRKLRELDTALVETIPRVRGDADEEAIHDLRVAIRRLRTLLKMARKLFGRWHADVVRNAFAEVMKATGNLRDEEVLEETLEGASEHPEFGTWVHKRKSREKKLRANVVTRIERGDLDRARLMLKALLVFPVEPKRNAELGRFARRTVERARRDVEAKRDVGIDDVTGLHDLRIAYKELRYSIELLAEALPIDERAMLEPATVFQKRLGEVHDVDVALDVLTHAKALPDDARAQAKTKLGALRDKRISKYLRELDPMTEHQAKSELTNGSPANADPERPLEDADTVAMASPRKE